MKKIEPAKIRNIAFLSHGGCGKTTLTEAILFATGTIERQGTVEAGNTTCDYEPEEIKRKMSITLSLSPVFYREHKINIIDTPGYDDFVGEVISALSVVENALILVSAQSGIEVGTEKVLKYAKEAKLSTGILVNRIDKENSNFRKVLEDLKNYLEEEIPVAVEIPLGESEKFSGIIDLIRMKAVIFTENGRKVEEKEIPEEFKKEAEEYREKLVEIAAETDDELTNKYLEGEELTPEEIKEGIRKGVENKKVIPVFCGSAYKNIGILPLLDAIIDYFSPPTVRGEVEGTNPKTKEKEKRKTTVEEKFSALTFKTLIDPFVGRITFLRVFSGVLTPDIQIYNPNRDKLERISQIYIQRGKNQIPVPELPAGDIGVLIKLSHTLTSDTLCDKDAPIIYPEIKYLKPIFSLAVHPKSKGDEEKMSTSLAKLTEEDPTFKLIRDHEIKQSIIQGRGEMHLDVIIEKLQRKFGVAVTTTIPKIPYKETIKGRAKVQGKYKRQSGGRGQYGDVWIEIEPLPRGEGFQFIDKIVGGVIPRNYIPAVEKGIREAMQEGNLAGYPITDIKVTLYDGSHHVVDSSDIAFQIAGSMALRKGVEEANPVLLEPIVNLTVEVPKENMGDIIGDLNGKRGKILGTEARGNIQIIKAQVPLAEVQRYAIDLRSLTQGRGSYEMEFSHYEEVPSYLAEKIIAQAKKEEEKK